ncbi:MAG: exopolyphosphatase/guanosine-5'-triphosphate,3'-diphosphate pyrophosphatase [Limisphaerales bacterium]|jgi:exopolyphosphatase/guanosine-5'-triphosphate,3'-diphosphate pyrophosphatase
MAGQNHSVVPRFWAALDLGSNSFHLLLVGIEDDRVTVLERLKEKVQLLGGAEDGVIQAEAFTRGLQCIARFKQRLSGLDNAQMVVMGTHALRRAKNADPFIEQVGSILGSPLSVISGRHEAELIFKAVGFGFGVRQQDKGQMVIDIGGGSTEFGLGAKGQASTALSLEMGCVAYKDLFFKAGQSVGYEAAKRTALECLDDFDLSSIFDGLKDAEVLGTSGTIESVQTVLRANGWVRDTITADAMQRLEVAIVDEQWIVEAGLPGLSPDRVDIFPAGVAILKACFEKLQLETLRFVDVSLLHGMILDAIGTGGRPYMRSELANRSVDELAQRFGINRKQASRVGATALVLFEAARSPWVLGEESKQWLVWAAQLHELGMQVNVRHYHRHGSYILKHAELPGVDEHERNIVALLIRGHRRSLPGLAFQAFDPTLVQTLTRLVAILRLAAILERSHSDGESPTFTAAVSAEGLKLNLENDWLAKHKLSAKELEVEIVQLATAGIELEV